MGQLQGQLQAEVKRLQGQVQQARSDEEEAQEQRHALKLQLTKVGTQNLDPPLWEGQTFTPLDFALSRCRNMLCFSGFSRYLGPCSGTHLQHALFWYCVRYIGPRGLLFCCIGSGGADDDCHSCSLCYYC